MSGGEPFYGFELPDGMALQEFANAVFENGLPAKGTKRNITAHKVATSLKNTDTAFRGGVQSIISPEGEQLTIGSYALRLRGVMSLDTNDVSIANIGERIAQKTLKPEREFVFDAEQLAEKIIGIIPFKEIRGRLVPDYQNEITRQF